MSADLTSWQPTRHGILHLLLLHNQTTMQLSTESSNVLDRNAQLDTTNLLKSNGWQKAAHRVSNGPVSRQQRRHVARNSAAGSVGLVSVHQPPVALAGKGGVDVEDGLEGGGGQLGRVARPPHVCPQAPGHRHGLPVAVTPHKSESGVAPTATESQQTGAPLPQKLT